MNLDSICYFTATEIARELEIVQDWRGEDIDAFLRDVGTEARSFDEWLQNASAWAVGISA